MSDVRDDLDDALRFLSIMGMQDRAEQLSLSVRLRALIRLLIDIGAISRDDLAKEIKTVTGMEKERISKLAVVHVAEVKNKREAVPAIIDCESRHAVCKSRCCGLQIPLSSEDIDEGIRFDYGHPFMALKGDDGLCHYLDRDTHRCGIYEKRPAICRTYSCEGDDRIWSNFDRLIPADRLLVNVGAEVSKG